MDGLEAEVLCRETSEEAMGKEDLTHGSGSENAASIKCKTEERAAGSGAGGGGIGT